MANSIQTENTADQLLSGLLQLNGVIEALYRQQAREQGLSVLQLRLLQLVLSGTPGRTPAAVARELKLSKATVSVAIRGLEQKRLLSRKPREDDGRSVRLVLSERGTQIAHITGFTLEPLRRILVKINAGDKEVLQRNIEGILQRLDQLWVDELTA